MVCIGKSLRSLELNELPPCEQEGSHESLYRIGNRTWLLCLTYIPFWKKKKKSDFLSLSITKRPFFSNCISGKMVTWSLSAVFAPIWNMPFWITGNSKDILNQKILWSQCNVPNIVYIYLLWKCISIFVLVFWLMFSFQNPSNEKYRFKRKTDRRKKTPNILHNKEYIFIW